MIKIIGEYMNPAGFGPKSARNPPIKAPGTCGMTNAAIRYPNNEPLRSSGARSCIHVSEVAPID